MTDEMQENEQPPPPPPTPSRLPLSLLSAHSAFEGFGGADVDADADADAEVTITFPGKRRKSVTWYNKARVMLIPSLNEYYELGMDRDLWFTADELCFFKHSFYFLVHRTVMETGLEWKEAWKYLCDETDDDDREAKEKSQSEQDDEASTPTTTACEWSPPNSPQIRPYPNSVKCAPIHIPAPSATDSVPLLDALQLSSKLSMHDISDTTEDGCDAFGAPESISTGQDMKRCKLF